MRTRKHIIYPVIKDTHGQPLRPFRTNLDNNVSKAMDQLAGICKGILADGVLVDQEAVFFRNWITQHAELQPIWPWTDILARIETIFADGQIDDEEREELRAIMQEITGSEGDESEVENKSMTLPLDDPQPPIVFPQTPFCITGRFAFGTRSRVFEAISARGGIAKDSFPTKDTRFLVIGTFASRDWYYTHYGRKIERAAELRVDHSGIAIVSEEHWRKYLE